MVQTIFRTFNIALSRIVEVLVGCAFLLMIVSVTIQVFGRSPLLDAPVWTEELTRFALLYLTAFGVGLSFVRGDLVNVDIVCEALPGKLPWVLRLFSAAVVAFLSGALLVPAYKFMSIGAFQTSPALGWRMDYIHASVLVMLSFLFLFALVRMLSLLIDPTTGAKKELEVTQ